MGDHKDSRSRSQSIEKKDRKSNNENDSTTSPATAEESTEEGEHSPSPPISTSKKEKKTKKESKKIEKKSKRRKSKKDRSNDDYYSPGKKRHRSRQRSHSRSERKKKRKESKEEKKKYRHSSSERSRKTGSRERNRSKTRQSRDRKRSKDKSRERFDRSRDRKRNSRDRRRGSRYSHSRHKFDDRRKSSDRQKSFEKTRVSSKSPQKNTNELAKQRAELAQRNREKFRLYASGELEKGLMNNGTSQIAGYDSFSIHASPKKRKHTVKDAFCDSSDSDDNQPAGPHKYGNFNMKLDQKRAIGRPSWKGGWLRSPVNYIDLSATKVTETLPVLIPAPSETNQTNSIGGMPTLTPKPRNAVQDSPENESKSQPENGNHHNALWLLPNGSSPLNGKFQVLNNNGLNGGTHVHVPNDSVIEDITDDEMDISDSDEYDQNEINRSLDESSKNCDDSQQSLKNSSVPAPPPLRSRPSRFSSVQSAYATPPPLARAPTASLTPRSTTIDPSALKEKFTITNEKFSAKDLKIEVRIDNDDMPPVPEFLKLSESDYLCHKDLVKAGKDSRKMECDCRLPSEDDEKPCGENCLNRLMAIECSNRCKCGDKCTNKAFQKKLYKKLEIFWAKDKGHGLKSKENIQCGEFVIEYIGEIVTTKEFTKRSHEYSKLKSTHHYFMELTRGATIDASRKGQISRFINHSCDPNCETQKWTVNGLVRVGFFAIREIMEGEEITFDYQFIHFGKGQKCHCGSSNCRGVIGREAAYNEYKRKAGLKEDEKDIDYSKEITAMKPLDSTEDMMKLGRWMALTKHDDIKARKKSLTLVKEARNDLQRTFMSYHGLDILWSFAKDDQFDEGELRPDLIDLLYILPVNIRDKVEDSGLLGIVEKWAKKRNDPSAGKAGEIAEKWQKCFRRIPLRPKSALDIKDESEQTILPQEEPNRNRRKSPRLAASNEQKSEILSEQEIKFRETQREERRRKFEEQVKWEAEAKETVKLSIDDRLRAALENDDSDVFDAPSPDPNDDYDFAFDVGAKTPKEQEFPQWNEESYWNVLTKDDKKIIAQRLCKHYEKNDNEDKLEIGFGTIVAKNEITPKEGTCLVMYSLEEVEHLKAIAELARIGLEQRDRRKREEKDREREKREREKRRIEASKLAAQEAEKKKRNALMTDTTEVSEYSVNFENQNCSENSPKEKAVFTEEIILPEHWATARDGEGNIYYYHTITRETSWDQPTISDSEKIEKENKLKKQLERFIGELLLSYRDPEAQAGRITKDEDYRHLIKRLTYGLLKRVIGELKTYRMNEKAKNMASKYCHKYMLRQGEVYKRKHSLTSNLGKISTQLPTTALTES